MSVQGRTGGGTLAFSGFLRAEWIRRLAGDTFDVLVIGGGITGAGIALDAVTRGMKTALIDMQDFAAGTSSRSTKLVHGGLRYLKQLDLKLVAEAGREREVVYRNAPHVTTPLRMLLPLYKGGTFGPMVTSAALRLYDWLAGVRHDERRVMLSARETLEKEPLLSPDGLIGGGYYVEYRTDDARLTIEIIKKAVEKGAAALNYIRAEKLRHDADGIVCGIEAKDVLSGAALAIHARKVVNAAGPWVDAIRKMDGSRDGKRLRLTKGVHLVFDRSRFPLRQAVYFDVPDGRMMFAIPRDGKTYVGTSDTVYDEDPASPTVTEEDRSYILKAVNAVFPGLHLASDDVESDWAGIRPLIWQEGKKPSEISRRDEIFRSASGLISIAGGKLTGYRKMAEKVTDIVARELEGNGSSFEGNAGDYGNQRSARFGPCVTRDLPLSGGDFGGSDPALFGKFVKEQIAAGMAAGLQAKDAERLARRYGSNAEAVFAKAAEIRESAVDEPLLPLDLLAELRYCMEEEMCVCPADFWIRRTGALYFDIGTVRRYCQAVNRIMAHAYGWHEDLTARFELEMKRELEQRVSRQG